MKWNVVVFSGLIILGLGGPAAAQVAVSAASDQEALLVSGDARLAANKRLVYDFWREVFEGGHLDLAPQYLAPGYIQHNPNVPTGREGFVLFFSKFAKPKPTEARIKAPLVAIVAEGDLVVFSFAHELADPKDASHHYTTTWFDMFRVADGKIVEHWDPAEIKH
ncbi:MAG: nuclear transport factor 2 family protein [Burkholderiaceae bacterium]